MTTLLQLGVCALKLTHLGITSLLFDLNYNLLMGASLLALAKSIYYFIKPAQNISACGQQNPNGLTALSLVIFNTFSPALSLFAEGLIMNRGTSITLHTSFLAF